LNVVQALFCIFGRAGCAFLFARTAILSGLSLLYYFLICRVHDAKTPQWFDELIG
jgi:hypothetical protein